ncbi:hypothetical protein ACFL6R_05130 [Gemmatimonadota bacterium]
MAIETDACRELQKHLNTMPVGYPATRSGVELKLLKAVLRRPGRSDTHEYAWRAE